MAEFEVGRESPVETGPEASEPVAPAVAPTPARCDVEIVHASALDYAMEHCGVPIVAAIRVKNVGEATLHDGVFEIGLGPDLGDARRIVIPTLPPGESFEHGAVDLEPPFARLREVRESEPAEVRWHVFAGGRMIASGVRPLRLLAFNEWPGDQAPLELLAAFVTPNQPAVVRVLQEVKSILRDDRAGESDDAIYGYQSQTVARARVELGALYLAVQRLGLSYVGVAASFEHTGQKVRLPDQLLREGMGNCLDLSLLFAACLEQMGYAPIVIVAVGHALPAVWLIDERFADACVTDGARLRNQIRLGNVVAFDAATAVVGSRPELSRAIAASREYVDEDARFVAAIDVRVARRARFLPLPIAVRDSVAAEPAGAMPERGAIDTGDVATSESTATHRAGGDPGSPASPHAAAAPVGTDPVSRRLARWKERLLDLTLRNRLLAMRRDRGAIPLEVPDLSALEDGLAADRDFEILPFPKLEAADPRAEELLAERLDPEDERRRLLADLAARRLHTTLVADQLVPLAKKLFRQARTDLEEGGANTLFVVLGTLKWYESPAATEPRHAPLLLVPVRLFYEPRLDRIRLRRTEEDPIGNVTLVEKLKRDFAIDLALLADPEWDDSGVDVPRLLRGVRDAIQAMPRAEVLEEAFIASFTFGKFLMWRDLEVNAEALLANPLVRHVAEGGARPWPDQEPTPGEDELDRGVNVVDLPTVLDADSTQLAAMVAALRGRSFVLQGPPGTGKSQTISNLIAAALAAGRSVLFVSEKMAALEVVHRRLEQVGLGDFCLELHSNKSSKKQVLESIGRAVARDARAASSGFAENAAKLATLREVLNDYVTALHCERPIGATFHRASARVLELAGAPRIEPSISLPKGAATPRETLDLALDRARDLAGRARRVDPVATHPWRDSDLREWTDAAESGIREAIDAVRSRVIVTERAFAELIAASGVRCAANLRLAEAVAEVASRAREAAVPEAVVDETRLIPLVARAEAFANLLAADETDRAELGRRYRVSVFELGDAAESLRATFERHAKSNVLVRFFALKGAKKQLAPHVVGDLGDAELVARDLARVVACNGRARTLEDSRHAVDAELGDVDITPDADSQAWRHVIERARRVAASLAELRRLGVEGTSELAAKLAVRDRVPRAALADRGDALRAACRELREADAVLRSRAVLTGPTADRGTPAASGTAPDDATFESTRETLAARTAALPKLRDWCAYARVRGSAIEAGLEAIVAAHANGTLEAGDVVAATERAILERCVALLRDAEPLLRDFDGDAHDTRVEEFRAADRTHVAASRAHVAAQLDRRRPAGGSTLAAAALSEQSEPAILQRELKKKARHMPLRKLFARIPNLIARLKPCYLMSPLSVAQYLPPEGRRFDLVVFDEASQIGTHDAIGTIARGSQVMIVGDSRQLPPTAFFHRAAAGGEDDAGLDAGDASIPSEEPEIEELESVLDEAVAARLPERHLAWHYRSRHESLIRFSNRFYYEDRLHVFPAALGRVPELGVKWHPVPDGEYDFGGTRTNPREARVLVDWLVAALAATKPGERSFGVVTFSQPQQTLVLDLLDEARRARPEIEGHFSADLDEPVFVKNLENVQGDERDEILFGICYARSKDGKVRMNFGPLNQSGGERRLNVAVTRARRALRVFSTLTHDQIDLTRTAARGAHHLREFLRYAAEESRGAALERMGTGEHDSEFERQVGAAIEALGHAVDSQVGCGRYRIDLAVRHPTRPGVHVLGVECDGSAYHSAATARDRDRLRQQVLENLGWRLHRVWSSEWWFARDREIERLSAAIRAAIDAAAARDADESQDAPVTNASSPASVASAAAPDANAVAYQVPDASVVAPSEVPAPPANAVVPDANAGAPPANAGAPDASAVAPDASAVARPDASAIDLSGGRLGDHRVEVYERAKLPELELDGDALADPATRPRLLLSMRELIRVEAPLYTDEAVRRVARACGISRLRDRGREVLVSLLRQLESEKFCVLRGEFVWRSADDPSRFTRVRGADAAGEARAIDEIALEEIAAAATACLGHAFSLPLRDLLRATAKILGTNRLTKDAEARVKLAVDSLLAAGRARVVDERVEHIEHVEHVEPVRRVDGVERGGE